MKKIIIISQQVSSRGVDENEPTDTQNTHSTYRIRLLWPLTLTEEGLPLAAVALYNGVVVFFVLFFHNLFIGIYEVQQMNMTITLNSEVARNHKSTKDKNKNQKQQP